MEQNPSDHSLVAATLKGDIEAFSVLVRRYQAAVHAFALSRVGDFEAAEDIAQETFVAAFLELSELREPARFASWLRSIAANLSAAWVRRRARESMRVSGLDSELAERAISNEPSPEEMVLRHEREKDVLCALSSLTPDRAAAVTLYYSDGLSYRECAEFLEVNVSTIEARLHKARRQLQKEVLAMTEATLKHRSPGTDFTDAIEQEIETLVGAAGSSGKLAPKQKALDKLDLLFTRNPDRLVEMVKGASRLEDLETAVGLSHRCGPKVVRVLLPLVLDDDEIVRRNSLAALPRDLDGTYAILEVIHESNYSIEQRVEMLLALLDRADELKVIGDDHWTGSLKTPRQPKHVIEQFTQHQQLYAEMLGLYEEEAYPRLVAHAVKVFGHRRFVTFEGTLANALCRFGDRCLKTMTEFLVAGSDKEVRLALRVLQFFGAGWNEPRVWAGVADLSGPELILSRRITGKVTTGWPPIPPQRVSDEALDHTAKTVALFLDHTEREVVIEAVATLADLRRPCCADIMRQAVQSPDPTVRGHAVRGLSVLGRVEDLELLVCVLETDEDPVKTTASDALMRMSIDALDAAANARSNRISAEQLEQYAQLIDAIDHLRPRIMSAITEVRTDLVRRKPRHPGLSEQGYWSNDFVKQLASLREEQPIPDRELSVGETAAKKRLERIRGGEAHPLFYVYLPAVLRHLPEDRDYHEVELTHFLSHGNHNYALARRTLIVEKWMTRENNIYCFTETGRRAWRMEKVLEQAAKKLCGMEIGA